MLIMDIFVLRNKKNCNVEGSSFVGICNLSFALKNKVYNSKISWHCIRRYYHECLINKFSVSICIIVNLGEADVFFCCSYDKKI